MQRRLPYEPEHLIELLTSWIEWRYGLTRQRLVLTSAPTSVPQIVDEMMPGAVWRLAWHEDSTAVLYGLAPASDPDKYWIVRHDAARPRGEGVFERLADGAWLSIDGDTLQSRLEGANKERRGLERYASSSRRRRREHAKLAQSRQIENERKRGGEQ